MRRRRKPKPGTHFARTSAMAAAACATAVSEMSGVPSGEMCGWVLVTLSHPAGHPGKHALAVMPSNSDFAWAERILGQAVADMRAGA